MITTLIQFLAAHYQQDNFAGVTSVARTMLQVIPEDLVALQFLALASLQLGARDKALALFRKAAAINDRLPAHTASACVPANLASYEAATRSDSGLAEGWQRISVALEGQGLDRLAARARLASTRG